MTTTTTTRSTELANDGFALVSRTRPEFLHLPNCEHFYDEIPPAHGTTEQIATLPRCQSCVSRYAREAGR